MTWLASSVMSYSCGAAATVTVQVAVWLPSVVVAVRITSPAARAVTLLSETTTMPSLFMDQV